MKKFLFIFLSIISTSMVYSQMSISGDYNSLRGVKTTLGVYCYNCGYLNHGDMRENLCFEKFSNDLTIPDGWLSVYGHIEDRNRDNHDPHSSHPVNGEGMSIFIVESFITQDDAMSLNGEWRTHFGNNNTMLNLDIKNGMVRGFYDFNNGKIEGTLTSTREGAEIRGTWHQANNSGWFVFRLDDHNGFRDFKGEWGYNNEPGRAKGKWDGSKAN